MPALSEARRLCSGRAWVELTTPYRLACAIAQKPCALCGARIDYSLHRNHRLAFTVDHITPLWQGGPPLDPGNWQPAHRRCNSSRGAKETNKIRFARPHPPNYKPTEQTWVA